MSAAAHDREVIRLPAPPRLADSYRAALRGTLPAAAGRTGGGDVPAVTLAHTARADVATLTAYQHLLGLPATDSLPAGYVHVLGFPLAMTLMTRRDFPLPVLGLVHLANRVVQRRPLHLGEDLDLAAWADGLRPHRRGTVVDVHLVARAGDDVAWEGTSTYLAKGRSPGGTAAAGEAGPRAGAGADADAEAQSAAAGPGQHVWRLGADIGRRYATVTGDRNPIHTSRAGARLFGFPRTIAHGMYTAARALAELPHPGGAFEWTAEFAKPVLLPGTVVLRFGPYGGGWSYVARSRSGKPHLQGHVRPTDS